MEDLRNEMEVNEVEETTEIEPIWRLENGEEVSKSAFVREQFLTFNKSRKEISEEFGINYRTVYGATLNLENDAESSTRGRTSTKVIVFRDEDDNVLLYKEEEHGDIETEEMDKSDYIKARITVGASRADVAEELGMSYGAVYNASKEVGSTRKLYTVTLADGTVVSRNEYIRMLAAEGLAKAEIAKKLGVDYPVVWAALSKDKSVADKFNDAIEKLNKFRDDFVDAESFDEIVEMLKALELKAETEETEETEEA